MLAKKSWMAVGAGMCLATALWSGPAGAAVRINEIGAAASSRLLQPYSTNAFQVGAGIVWYAPEFSDANWIPAPGPFGFGAAYTNGTNLTASMRYAAMSFYVRSAFTADAATATSDVQITLSCDFDDGFIAYLNGREIIRKNMGAPGSFAFCDQAAFNLHTVGTNNWYALGAASNVLVAGTNLFCVQVHNDKFDGGTFGWRGSIEASDGISTQTLMAVTNRSRILVGFGEPSGGISILTTNTALTTTGREWAYLSFDDGGWLQGPGGIGFGDNDDATVVSNEMYGITPSLYMRQTFTVSPAVAALTNRVRFNVNYDDGYIAYLNGVEIARAGMGNPGEFFGFDVLATSAREATAMVTNTLGACSNLLVSGTNVLAIQVHNNALADNDLSMIADLLVVAATNITLASRTNMWRYFVGLEPPVPEADAEAVSEMSEFCDWIELWNDGASSVSLAGWSLTDDAADPRKWWFPTGASIPANGSLLVLCSGASGTAASSGPPYQASFKLQDSGEYLGLYNAAGSVVSEFSPGYPRQSLFHSYGWSSALATNVYWTTPTPGTTNAGTVLTNIVEDPEFNLPAGFYTNSITVYLTCPTTNAFIYYTTNGAVPLTNNSTLYVGSGISVTTGRAIRARAFLNGCIPSRTVTRTYLVNQPSALRTIPAISLVGDASETFFKSNGITTIVGGTWVSGVWYNVTIDDINIPKKYGRPYERQTSVEFMETGTTGSVYRADAGVRVAGSTYTRPRYYLQFMSTNWNGSCEQQKPQMNLYFRDDYGESPFQFPFIPGSRVDQMESIRLRGGHNDYNNPFIRDELTRRLFSDMGQVSSRGRLVSLYINGIFRCYYNPTERLHEPFFQNWHRSTNEWDVINHAGLTEGDSIAYNSLLTMARTLNCSVLSNYLRIASLLDMVNFADYIMVNTYGATWDWPGNNFYTAHEKTSNGLFRFYVWDAEGAFSNSGTAPNFKTNGYDTIGMDLLVTNSTATIPTIFRALQKSAEFKLLMADRFQKHVVHGPALSASNVLARTWEMKNELDPEMFYVRNAYMTISIITNWVPYRPGYMIEHFRKYGLLPNLAAPDFTVPGGTVTNGTQISIVNTNGSGQVYYALDGADPRAVGGAIAGTLYTGPITIDRSRQIKARCYDGIEWSAVQEETYLSTKPPIVITEIMYNPEPSGAEFVELFNAGSSPVDMRGFYFSDGIVFDFATSPVTNLNPGEYCVVVLNPAFTARYGTNGIRIAGSYSGKLDNSGERLELSHAAFGVIATVSFSDAWFPMTDGTGFSLNARDATTEYTLLSQKASWRASSLFGGTPGRADGNEVPLPGSVVINEALTHTDASPDGDWIELFNTTPDPISLSGWWLSDDETTPCKYQIPTNTIIPAQSFLVFSASNHFDNLTNALLPFGLSEYGGEEIVLSSALDELGRPTGYREVEPFTAQQRETTFGRHIKSTGKSDFVAQRASTRGTANAGPLIGPVVIAQIHYAPSTNRAEYIQLYNMTNTPTPLFNTSYPSLTWKLTNAITYAFPTGIIMQPWTSLIVCATSPAAFRTLHALSTNYPVFGPYTGTLDNAGETLQLIKPLDPDTNNAPCAIIESINYNNTAPWPVLPALGWSIDRAPLSGYCNDPLNWRPGTLTNGTPGPILHADSDLDGIPDTYETLHHLSAQDPADASSDTDADKATALREFIEGTDPENPDDRLHLDTLLDTNGAPRVTFERRPATGTGYEPWNRFYALDLITDLLATNWTPPPACTNIPAATNAYTYTGATNTPAIFRSRVWLAPK